MRGLLAVAVVMATIIGTPWLASGVRGADEPELQKAAEPADAVRGYWSGVRSGRAAEAAMAYIDFDAMVNAMEQGVGAPELTEAQRRTAVTAMTTVITSTWEDERIAAAVKDSRLELRATNKVNDDTVRIDYVVTVQIGGKPTTLPNGATVRRTATGWKIVDMHQSPTGPSLVEAMRRGFGLYRKEHPQATVDVYLGEMVEYAKGKLNGGARK